MVDILGAYWKLDERYVAWSAGARLVFFLKNRPAFLQGRKKEIRKRHSLHYYLCRDSVIGGIVVWLLSRLLGCRMQSGVRVIRGCHIDVMGHLQLIYHILLS